MSQNEIVAKIEQLKEWEAILEEAQAEAEALRDSIKQQMLLRMECTKNDRRNTYR